MATRMLVSTASGVPHIRHLSNTTSVQGYQECGLTGKTGGTATGLATTTQYWFKVNCDGHGVVEKSITTAADVTYTAVIALMNAQMTGLLAGVVWALNGGDLRCTSPTWGQAGSIALADGTSGTNLFVTLTGFTAFDTAVAGLGPAEDPMGLGVIPSSGASRSYAHAVGGNSFGGGSVVNVFADGTTVTGTPAVEGAPGDSGPWAQIGTVTNPTTSGTLVPVPFGTNATRVIRVNAGSYTGGPLRATISVFTLGGGRQW